MFDGGDWLSGPELLHYFALFLKQRLDKSN